MCQKCDSELDVGTHGRLPTAETAHIRALHNGGTRAVPELSIEERNSIGNLILLCPTCHDLVDKNEEEYPIATLEGIKRGQEERATALRQAGQAWHMRYATVDYLNLPRIAAMPGANLIMRAAEETRLVIDEPFRKQGAKPGFFLVKIHPLFAVWDARAVPLTETTAANFRQGMYISFEQPMQARNTHFLPTAPKEASWEKDPQLVCSVGGRRVRIRFDPDWITTATPVSDLKNSAAQAVVYAGLGLVVGVSDSEILVSARVFGQPQTPTSAMWEYMKSARESMPNTLSEADFINEFSTLQNFPSGTVSEKENYVEPKTVAFYFDEDEVFPGKIERKVFTQIFRVVPEFRRDVRVAVYSLSQNLLAVEGTNYPTDIAVGVLAGKLDLWKTMAVPELATAIRHTNLTVARVEEISLQQANDLHATVKEDFAGYLGAAEIDLDLETHRRLHSFTARYRLVGTDLHLMWSEMERAMSGDDIEDKIAEWENSEIFQKVEWQEGVGPHDAELSEAANAFVEWIKDNDD